MDKSARTPPASPIIGLRPHVGSDSVRPSPSILLRATTAAVPADALRETGLTVTGPAGEWTVKPNVVTPDEEADLHQMLALLLVVERDLSSGSA